MTIKRALSILLVLLVAPVFSLGCRPRAKECVTMNACCDVLRGTEGIGNACSKKLLDGIERPDECLAVLQSVEVMYEGKPGRSIPQECVLKGDE